MESGSLYTLILVAHKASKWISLSKIPGDPHVASNEDTKVSDKASICMSGEVMKL